MIAKSAHPEGKTQNLIINFFKNNSDVNILPRRKENDSRKIRKKVGVTIGKLGQVKVLLGT